MTEQLYLAIVGCTLYFTLSITTDVM